MTQTHQPCEPERLFELRAGTLTEPEATRLRVHLDGCNACRNELASVEEIADASRAMRPAAADDDVRERSWAAVAGAAQSAAAQQQRRHAIRVLRAPAVALLAAAAAVAAIAFIAYWTSTPPEIVRVTPTPVVTTTPTPQVVVDNRLACGARVDGPDARFRVVKDNENGAVVELQRGTVDVDVPTLAPHQSMVVLTADARVTVHGTRFTVFKGNGTRVVVTEGVVSVEPVGRPEQNRLLRAGDSFDVPTFSSYLAALETELDRAIDANDFPEAKRLGGRYIVRSGGAHETPQVQLRLAGVHRQLGQTDEAVQLYRQVADGSAGADVRENALALLASLHTEVGHHSAAESTWRELVQRFPNGMHAAEARVRLGAHD